jgi:cytochrome c553
MNRVIIFSAALLLFAACQSEEETSLPDAPGKITVIDGESASDNVSPLIGYSVTGEYQVRIVPPGEDEDETTRMIGAEAVSRSAPYSTIGRRLAERSLGKDYLVKCAPCHDDYANGVIGPSLLDRSPEDIYTVIIKYRHNEKTNRMMRSFVDKMSEGEIRDMAERISEFNKMMKGAEK